MTMRNFLKSIILVLVIVGICFALAGCKKLSPSEEFYENREDIFPTDEQELLENVKDVSKKALADFGIEAKDMFVQACYFSGDPCLNLHVLTEKNEYNIYEIESDSNLLNALIGAEENEFLRLAFQYAKLEGDQIVLKHHPNEALKQFEEEVTTISTTSASEYLFEFKAELQDALQDAGYVVQKLVVKVKDSTDIKAVVLHSVDELAEFTVESEQIEKIAQALKGTGTLEGDMDADVVGKTIKIEHS